MTLDEAVKRGIRRVRDPKWADPRDYMLIDLIQRPLIGYAHGPWLRLYSPIQPAIGQPTPQVILFTCLNWKEEGWEPYNGELNGADTNG